MNYLENFLPQGWVCPTCGRVYSPTTIMCFYCGGNTTSTTYGTGTPFQTDTVKIISENAVLEHKKKEVEDEMEADDILRKISRECCCE